MKIVWLLFLVMFPFGAAAKIPISGGALSAAGDPIDQVWQMFRAGLEREAPGKFDIKFLIRGETGGEEALMSAVRRGRMHVASFTVSGMSAIVPEFSVIMMPYLFASYEELDFVLDNFLAEPLRVLAAEKNLHVFGWLDDGWLNLYAKDPLLSPKDLDGYPMRAWQVPSSRVFFETLGADTIGMPFPDIIPSLQTGLIKGSEIAPMTYDGMGLAAHARHYVLTRHAYNTGLLVANKSWIESLVPAERTALIEAVPDKLTARALLRDGVPNYYESMVAQGAVIHALTEDQRARWVVATRPVHEALLQTLGQRARDLYEVIQDGKSAFRDSNNLRDVPSSERSRL